MDVLYSPAGYELLDAGYWQGKAAVVIDVLRATSTMVTALAGGYAGVVPCRELEEARALKLPGVVLGGERGGLAPEGFDKGNSPREYLHGMGERLVMTTTNGTRAFAAARGAELVVAGSFLNLSAVVQVLRERDLPVVLVCAGTGEDFALEDALLAGAVARALGGGHAAEAIYGAYGADLESTLKQTCNGRRLAALGLGEDVEWCARIDRYQVVPAMDADGILKAGHEDR